LRRGVRLAHHALARQYAKRVYESPPVMVEAALSPQKPALSPKYHTRQSTLKSKRDARSTIPLFKGGDTTCYPPDALILGVRVSGGLNRGGRPKPKPKPRPRPRLNYGSEVHHGFESLVVCSKNRVGTVGAGGRRM